MQDLVDNGRDGKRWYRFAYYDRPRPERAPLLHHGRDAEAALWLQRGLERRGYRYEGLIPNLPSAPASWGNKYAAEPDRLRANDMVVVMTGSSRDDAVDGARLKIDRSHSELESRVDAVFRGHFDHCSQKRVTVAPKHAKAWPEVARMSNVEFKQMNGAAIKEFMEFGSGKWQYCGRHARTSLAYLIFERSAWEGGPSLLAAFGMDEESTLDWSFLLSTRYPSLIASVPFVMAEITAPKQRPSQLTAELAHEWQVRLLAGERDIAR